MNAKAHLLEFKKTFDKEFKKYLDSKYEEAKKISPITADLMDHIRDFSMRGGKRIRPALFYYSFLAHGGKQKKEALRVSMAIELSETYLLIHDDIMDDDALRRGEITVHESYKKIAEERYHNKINPRQFGASMGINAGDIACAMSNETILNSKFDPELVRRAALEMNLVYQLEIYGQSLDLHSNVRDDLKPEDVIQIHQLKTVPYTFDGPLKIGALLAGATDKQIEKLEGFSVPLGTAFQMQDDILGMFGTEEKLGKPVTSDLKEGKKTLLILEALKKANKCQRETIISCLDNKRASFSDLKRVRKIVEGTGSLAKSKKMAEKYVRDSMKAIDKLKLKKEGKNFLLAIAEYMVKRDY